MKPLEKALALLPLLLAVGRAATQTPGTREVFEVPDRRPFANQPATELAEPRLPTTNDRRFEVVQRGTPFADEPKRKPDVSARVSPGTVDSPDSHRIPAGGLPATPRIVADELPIELFGFGLTPAEREKFDKERSQRISGRVKQRVQRGLDSVENDKNLPLACVAVFPLCPIFLPMTYGIAWTAGHAAGRIEGAVQEPSLISERDGLRLAAAFKERATGLSLQERTGQLAGAGLRPATDNEALPRLAIRLTAVRLHYRGKDISITVASQAQASASEGNDWPPTEHFYNSPLRPLAAWMAENDALVLQEIDNALEALASNIWKTYAPRQPKAVAGQPATGYALESSQSGK